MRLWHEDLIDKLPRQQLLGQHRECCALRGNGWDQNHSTVNYIFNYQIERLITYHIKVMIEMVDRGYNPSIDWFSAGYRGKNCEPLEQIDYHTIRFFMNHKVYPEHDQSYLEECIENLYGKEVVCRYLEEVIP